MCVSVCVVRPTGGGERGTNVYIYMFDWKNNIMDTRGKLLLIRYRFGELIID